MLLTATPPNTYLYRYVREVNATYGSETVACLEKVYQRAREIVPDLPANVTFTIKQSGVKGMSVTLGHFMPEGYKAGVSRDAVHEINITGSCLHRGPIQVLQTVLHEAAHALCEVRGIKDTTRQNRYHNKRFVKAAEELTLTYDDPQNYRKTYNKDGELVDKLVPDSTIGFSNVVTTDKTMEVFKEVYDMLVSDLPINKGLAKRPKVTPRTQDKVFCIFPKHDNAPEEYEGVHLRVFGPKKYEDQVDFLTPHVRVYSTLTLGVMVGLLEWQGVLTDKDEDTANVIEIMQYVAEGYEDMPAEVDRLVSLMETANNESWHPSRYTYTKDQIVFERS